MGGSNAWLCTVLGCFSVGVLLVSTGKGESLPAAVPRRPIPPGIQVAQTTAPQPQATTSTQDDQSKTTLKPVMVTAPRVSTPITKVPAAISVVDTEEIQLGQPTITLDEALVHVPGVFSQNPANFAQDLRVSIRGFGARSAFGVRGIKILVDGIPETLPDGQSQVDGLDPGMVQSIEVLRGPSSALYGNAAGGVISLTTEDAPARPVVEARTTHGEYGLWKWQVKGGGQTGPLNAMFNFSRLEFGGYRDQSRTENVVFNAKLRVDLDDVSDVTALINIFHSPRADDPGALTREQVDADRRQAAPLSLQFDTGEEVSQQRLGLVYRRAFGTLHNLELTGFFTARQFRGAVPFRTVEFDRFFLGGGIKYLYHGNLFGHRNRLAVGLDVEHLTDRRQNFNNVDGSPGDTLLLNQDETVTSVGPYIQNEFAMLDNLTLLLGGRFDYVHFGVDDFFNQDEETPNTSGSRTFNQATGRLGLVYTPLSALNLYVNVAQSFETPTTTELVNQPGRPGGLNANLEPQKAVNYEIGAKGLAFHRLTYEVALFYISLRDELIPMEGPPGNVFFENAGESRRFGLELGLGYRIFEGLQASVAYTYLDAEFEDFVVDGVNLDGHKTPGLPEHQVFGEVFYKHPLGFYGRFDILYVSDFYVNNANTAENDAYVVANLRLGYTQQWRHWQLAPFFGIQNLFDDKYNANVRVNATGDRYFEPAAERNVYGGLTVAYHW